MMLAALKAEVLLASRASLIARRSTRQAARPFSVGSNSLEPRGDVADDGSKAAAARSCPHLRKVPSLPLLGSLIPQHSGLPKFALDKQYENGTIIRERFGDFMTMGFPGFGVGSHGTLYNLFDPDEMMKIVRSEGSRPSGIVEKIWSWRRALRESGSAMVSKKEEVGDDGEEYDYGLLDRGEGWKRQRTFLQTGMLDPRAARGFVPGIVAAAEQASRAAPAHADDVNTFLNYTAFDMFSSFMFGEKTCTASSVVSTNEKDRARNAENEKFVTAALGVFDTTNRMGLFPQEFLKSTYLPGMKSSMYRDFETEWNTVREVGLKKIHDFIDRFDKDELDDMERASYLASAIERQRTSGGVTEEEMIELCLFALFVGVDTTSSVTAWNLMHLAMNTEEQEKLHSELSAAVTEKGSEGGTKVNADVLGRSTSPYLHMCVRESHRVTPAFAAAIWKSNSRSDVEVYGETIPKGSMVQLGHISYDPDFVEDPMTFSPERWTDEAIAARAGTKSEVLDHPVLRDPFSQGARRCPGSRVANNEILAMIAQLVLDWKISAPTVKTLADVKYDCSPIKPIFSALKFEAR